MFTSLIFYSSLVLTSVSDFRHKKIPNILVYFLFITVLSSRISCDINLVSLNLISASAVFFFLVIIRSFTDGLGSGDIKLLFASTFYSGLYIAVAAITVACFLGIVTCIALKFFKVTIIRIPFAPFITLGYVSAELISKKII